MSEELDDIANRIIGWAAAGEDVEAYVMRGVDTDIELYQGEIESLSRAESSGVGVRVVLGERQGFAYAGTLDEDVLREALSEARDNATFATPDPFVGLARPDAIEAVSLDLWNDDIMSTSVDSKIDLTRELEKLVLTGDARISNLKSTNYGDGMVEAAIASTTGISASYRRSGCYISAFAIAVEGDDTQVGIGYSVGRSPKDLETEVAARDAIIRSTRMLGATRPQSANLTVVLDARVTPTFLSILSSALNGESVEKGRSFFAGREGQQVAVGAFTFADDPTNPNAYAAACFDGEGLATRRNELIKNGVLQGFLYDTYAGRRAGRASNGAAVRGGYKSGPSTGARAMEIVPGPLSQSEIISKIDNGVLVQSVMGVHSGVNPISGDLSVGAEGIVISNGELGGPIREFTIASTIQRMLLSVSAIGNDVDWLPSSAMGVTLAIDGMSLSGT